MSFEQWKKEAKRLVKLAIHKAGGQHAMSDSTGIDTSQLSRWGNEDDDERHIPLYRAMELDEAAGDAIFKGWLTPFKTNISDVEYQVTEKGRAASVANVHD